MGQMYGLSEFIVWSFIYSFGIYLFIYFFTREVNETKWYPMTDDAVSLSHSESSD